MPYFFTKPIKEALHNRHLFSFQKSFSHAKQAADKKTTWKRQHNFYWHWEEFCS